MEQHARSRRHVRPILAFGASAALLAGCARDPGGAAGGGSGGAGGGGGGGEAPAASLDSIFVGGTDLLAGVTSVQNGQLVHGTLAPAGADLRPSLRVTLADGSLESVRAELVSADGALPVFDGKLTVQDGAAVLPLDVDLFPDVPYRLTIRAPDGGELRWNGAAIAAARGCFFVAGALAEADTQAPAVSHLAVDRQVIEGEEPFVLHAAIADRGGVAQAEVELGSDFFGPLWSERVPLAYDPQTCLFAATATLPRWLPGGPWASRRLVANDGSGNEVVLHVDDRLGTERSAFLFGGAMPVSALALDVSGHTWDDVPPELASVSAVLDGEDLIVEVGANDADSGVASVTAHALPLDEGASGQLLAIPLARDETGRFRGTQHIAPWLASGVWTIAHVQIGDRAHNSVGFHSNGTAYLSSQGHLVDTGVPTATFVHETEGADTTAPVIADVWRDPPAARIETPGDVAFSVAVTDEGAGVATVRAQLSTDCDDDLGLAAYEDVVFGADGEGSFRGVARLFASDVAGTWTLCRVAVTDRAGNAAELVANDAGLYETTGRATAIRVPSFTFAPAPVAPTAIESVALGATSIEQGVLDLDIGVAETGAGVRGVVAEVHREDAAPARYLPLRLVLDRVGAGRWKARLNVLPGLDGGTWVVHRIVLDTEDGRSIEYRGAAGASYVRVAEDAPGDATPTDVRTATFVKLPVPR